LDIQITYDNATGAGDFAIAGGDLAMDETLDTAVLVSLFTDRVADPGDTLPPGSTDPRGWWGDTAFLQQQGDNPPDLIGSKLWLRVNGLLTQANLNQMGQDVLQALQWMIEDGVAQSVTCRPVQTGVGSAALPIFITRRVNGQPATTTYDAVWDVTMGLASVTRRCAS
jgi:phage gp46-like protein